MKRERVREDLKEAVFIFLPLFSFYLFFQTKGIFGGDCGDLVSAAVTWGIPHPPGYPLYTILAALLVRLVPFFTPAWRVALISSFSAALALATFFVLIKRLLSNLYLPKTSLANPPPGWRLLGARWTLFSRLRIPPGSVLGDEAGRKEADPSWKPPASVLGEDSLTRKFLKSLAQLCFFHPGGENRSDSLARFEGWLVSLIATLTLAFSYLFWLYAEVPEVFALNSFFIILLTFLALAWYEKPSPARFYLFIFFFGLSLSHHHTVLFLLPAFFYLFSQKKSFFHFCLFHRPRSPSTSPSATSSGSSGSGHLGGGNRHLSSLGKFWIIQALFCWRRILHPSIGGDEAATKDGRTAPHRFWCGAGRTSFFLILGLLPYLYLPIAARSYPPIDWGHPTNLSAFLAVVTRSVYGTFSSFQAAAQEALLRLVQIPAYLVFLNINVTTLGIFLALIGAIFLFKKDRILFNFFLLAFFTTGPFFVFYASFPLVNRLLIGTFERFLLLSLPFVVIFLGVGIWGLVEELMNLLRRIFALAHLSPSTSEVEASYCLTPGVKKTKDRQQLLSSLSFSKVSFSPRSLHPRGELSLVCFPHLGGVFTILFFLIPLFLLKNNLPRMLALGNDFFADRLGEDILKTTEPNSILILAHDQPLFNSQYVYYARQVRNDVKLIHQYLLNFDYYRDFIKRTYPEVVVPQEEQLTDFLQKFLKENSGRFPIYANTEVVEGGWREPIGLLFKYHPDEASLPSNEEVVEKNEKIWAQYQDLSPLWAKDYHIISLSVLDVYQLSRKRLGQSYLQAALFEEALEQFRQAQKLEEDGESFLASGTALAKLGRCGQAEEDLLRAISLDETKKIEAYYLLSLNAQYCWQDEEKAKEYKEIYQNLVTPEVEASRN